MAIYSLPEYIFPKAMQVMRVLVTRFALVRGEREREGLLTAQAGCHAKGTPTQRVFFWAQSFSLSLSSPFFLETYFVFISKRAIGNRGPINREKIWELESKTKNWYLDWFFSYNIFNFVIFSLHRTVLLTQMKSEVEFDFEKQKAS